jgi:hypothetical protein
LLISTQVKSFPYTCVQFFIGLAGFTVFAEVKGTSSSVGYTSLIVISGDVTSKGIANYQESLYLIQKSEGPSGTTLMPVNSGRVWFDNDRLAEKLNNYRIGIKEESISNSAFTLLGNQ